MIIGLLLAILVGILAFHLFTEYTREQ